MKLGKILFVVKRRCLSFVNYFDATKYTMMYSDALIKQGMRIDRYPKYIDPSVWFDGIDGNRGYTYISIGKDCVLSRDVVILIHDYSISRGLEAIGKLDPCVDHEVRFERFVNIGKNCFIGARSVILPGTTIGDNCIVGAGSVVRGNIPSNSVITGNPAIIVAETIEWTKKREQFAIQE